MLVVTSSKKSIKFYLNFFFEVCNAKTLILTFSMDSQKQM